ncbi:MAG: hypothetical protein A2X81_19540 [Desulfobacterales bacterium GWB2_56_26]|nr:MAG: hypothetical protein A2X81_19540 [Desulfobacterales bacterium GWB2_56_26]
MKVIRARIRGLGDTIESCWFELSPRLNLFHFPDEKGRASFLQALAALNPLFSCESTRPFADFPLISRQPYSKRIYPEKRTVALAIFNTTPDLVGDLAVVSPHLFQTDRIEVGRRLDYSRWINFVEIASSTRWREIAADMQQLADWAKEIAPEKAGRIDALAQTLDKSDRIKNGIGLALVEWLESLPAEIRQSSRQRIDNLARAIRRAEDFDAARKVVEQRLPIFTVLVNSLSQPEPLAPLLHRITGRMAELSESSAAGGRDFLEQLNLHLAAMRFSAPRLHVYSPATGTEVEVSATPALKSNATPSGSLMHLKAAVSLAIAFSQATCRTEPILLFDSPEQNLSGPLHRQLSEFILTVAEFCQCCYGYASVDIFSRHRGIPRYTVADLTTPGY